MSNVLDFLEARDFVHQKTSDELREILQKPISVYHGIDPTAPCLHLGNLVGLVMLSHFQRYGHRPIVLVGGATGLIGDPAGKDKERPLLSPDVIEQNVVALKQMIAKFLPSNGKANDPVFVNNYDWYKKMDVIEFLRDVGKQFRLGIMLGKESVRTRLASDEGMSFTEFSYQVLQGYDFQYLYEKYGVSLQIGGSDQYGNITAGTELIRKNTGSSAFGLSYPLLVRSDGKKFGKSEKGAIWLSKEYTPVFEFYQHLYRVSDADVIPMMKLLTSLPIEEIKAFEEAIQRGSSEPNLAQKVFAGEVTRFVHGEEGLSEALRATEAMNPGKMQFDEKGLETMIETIPHIDLQKSDIVGQSYVDLITKSGLIASKGEARRLIQNQGAYLNGQKILDVGFKLSEDDFLKGGLLILSAGKKNTVLIRAL